MREKILDMLELQDRLNRKINENWRDIRSKEDFARATWIECAELVDSLPWKWWKNRKLIWIMLRLRLLIYGIL